jgi:2-dehydropantoate 2-reductase
MSDEYSVKRLPDSAPIGIVGSGRVARHLAYYLSLLSVPTGAWSRHAATRAPTEILADCNTVLLPIRDDQIVPFINAWPLLRKKRLVHCSGSLVTPLAQAAHPLMTFGRTLYELDTYRQIPFILDSGCSPFSELLPGLPNPSFTIAAADRPYYHALCVLAGNCSTLLWQKLFAELQGRFAIPSSAAQPYLAQIAANLVADSQEALAGPFARGDVGTIVANLKALEGDPYAAVYRAFVKAYEHRS